VSMVASVAGLLHDGRLTERRPFRSPHHATSVAAMVGGGPHARPGEVSLAHKGVLFLDELPEFGRAILESLRQPLEAGRVTVARANHHVTYPARFQLVAAMNPCRCGHLDNPALACARAPRCARDYQGRISGPLFDRIDLQVEVPALRPGEIASPAPGELRATVVARVGRAREIQAERFAKRGEMLLRTNAEADGALLDAIATPDAAGRELLLRATERMHLTARGWHRVLRVARTIADLDGQAQVARPHIAEALSFRRIAPDRR
jgi:magnesium chelatase family protein